MAEELIPTILCGGAGSRLWPVSRELHPKPFMKLADGQSLLQKAFLRGVGLDSVNEIIMLTNSGIFFKIESDLQAINSSNLKTSYILEPFSRNTAAAIALGALHLIDTSRANAIMLILPADHLILDADSFQEAVSKSVKLAKQGQLVTFGIQPTRPETGYGYIESSSGEVLRFVEKPCYSVAEQYVAAGNFFWNSGLFSFEPSVIIKEMELHCPAIVDLARKCLHDSKKIRGNCGTKIELNSDSFYSVPNESIDYAVMEKSTNVAMVACDIGWTDVGSWNEVSDLSESDSDGNSIEGSAMIHDTQNCYIQSHSRIVGTVGIEDLIVVDTPDALLVANRDRSQDVKHLYTKLKTVGHESHKIHRTVHRPWGTYTVLEEGERFKIKRIEVKPGASLSLQIHEHRSEHWVVVCGRAKVINGELEFFVGTSQSTYIPAKTRHRLSNPTDSALVIIEVQSGEYLGEDDIVRLEDVYGRA